MSIINRVQVITFTLEKSNSIAQTSVFLQNFINILFFVILTSGLKFYRDSNRKQIQIKNLENLQLNTELSMLKSQINPHFLFNSLNLYKNKKIETFRLFGVYFSKVS